MSILRLYQTCMYLLILLPFINPLSRKQIPKSEMVLWEKEEKLNENVLCQYFKLWRFQEQRTCMKAFINKKVMCHPHHVRCGAGMDFVIQAGFPYLFSMCLFQPVWLQLSSLHAVKRVHDYVIPVGSTRLSTYLETYGLTVQLSLNERLHHCCVHEQQAWFPSSGDMECYGA